MQPGLTNRSLASGQVALDTDDLLDYARAELALSSTGGTITADGTEQTLFIVDEPPGCFVPRCVYVSLDDMAAGDTTVFRVYYRIADGGGLLLQDYQSYAGADGGLLNGLKMIRIDLSPNRHGVQVTLQQTGGVNADYPFEAFAEV